jgi:NitT/TauT family transport system substrate-binding protein
VSPSRKHLALLILLAGACLFAGCGRDDASSGATATPTEVRLGYFGNVTHAQAVLGVASGDFARAVAPAKFSSKVFNAGPSLIEALFADQIDVGYVGPGPALSAHEKSRGQGIRVIAGAAANGVLIVARKDSGIASLKDLAGKKLATPQAGNTQDIAARRYLTQVLGQKDTNNIVPVSNAEQAGMMARGDIDAAWAPEPWGSRLVIENGATVIAEEKDLWPNKTFVLTVVVTSPQFLAKHPETVKNLLGVHATWTDRLKSGASGYATQIGDALFALNGKRLPAGVLDASLRNVVFTADPLDETFQTMGQWAFDLGFAKAPPKLDGLVDTTILKQVRATAGAATRPSTTP